MDLNRIITMVINQIVRRGVNEGINRGIDAAARRGKRPEDMTEAERASAQTAKSTAQNGRSMLRQVRRLTRF